MSDRLRGRIALQVDDDETDSYREFSCTVASIKSSVLLGDSFDQGAITLFKHLTPSTDKYARGSRVESVEDVPQSILKIKRIEGG